MKKIPKLRFPGFSGEWEEDELGKVCVRLNVGFVGTCEKYYVEKNQGVPIIRTGDLSNGKIKQENFKYIDFDFHKLNKKSQVKKGDILIARHGSNGEASLFDLDFEANTLNIVIATPNKDIVTSKFILNEINSTNVKQQVLAQTAGSTQGVINTSLISKLKINFPSLPEQEKIASFLSEVDKSIEILEEEKELWEKYKKGMMQKIFSQKLRFKDENGNDYPEWEEKNGSDIFENISNKNHSSDLPILAITQDKGAIPREMIDMKVIASESSIESYKVVNKGDFIISLRSFQGGIEYSAYDGICSPAYIILKPKNEIIDNFFKNYLKTERYIQKLCSKLEGIRDGKMISYKYFSEIKLPFPSLPEQEKIANFLSTIDEKLEIVEEELELVKELKKGFLQKMFA